MKYLLILLSLLGIVLSCSQQKGRDKSGPEYTSKYICPMYCEGSGSDKNGDCSVCRMDYVLNKDWVGPELPEEYPQKDEMHEHDHGGHNHDHERHGH